jgi:hypothetical protein
MSKIITEITPLSEKDCFYLIDRRKMNFDYPIHRHNEVEVNFVSNCAGCKRVVGDSIEVLGHYDLAIIGPGLEHGWEQGDAVNDGDMREITIQFSPQNQQDYLTKNQLKPILELFENVQRGIAFGQDFIKSIIPKLDDLTKPQPGFIRLLRLLEIIYYMSTTNDCHILSTTSFANARTQSDSRRVQKVEEYISQNYTRTIYLNEMADLAGMAPTAFSRFFKARTGRTLSDYIIDMRLGHAARLLVDTNLTSAEVCYECGFNNISNFNRLFKKKKGCSPKTFRENYLKTKIVI